MTKLEKLIYEAIRFASWAAGEGLGPVDGEPAMAPEDFLFEYCRDMAEPDWDKLPEIILERLRA
jgi:hypothetical protein